MGIYGLLVLIGEHPDEIDPPTVACRDDVTADIGVVLRPISLFIHRQGKDLLPYLIRDLLLRVREKAVLQLRANR